MRTAVSALLVLACNTGKVEVAEGETDADTDTDTDADTDADTDTDGSTPAKPCFESDIMPILGRSCGGGDDTCHSPVAYAPTAANNCEGWLSLTDTPLGGDGCPPLDLYTRLITLHGWACLVNGDPTSGFEPLVIRYVAPFDPDASLLYQKLLPDGIRCVGAYDEPTQRMPLAAPLPQAEIDLIRLWIEQ